MLFVHTSHPLTVKILAFCQRKAVHPKFAGTKVKRKINPKFRCVIHNVTESILIISFATVIKGVAETAVVVSLP